MGVYTPRRRSPARAERDARPTVTGRAKPKYVTGRTVLDVALDRIRWLYDEYDNHISVSCSGGKDSTATVELALIVARERGALPLRVTWLDQECEFASTVTYQRWLADRPEIDFAWYQIPFRLFNGTNAANPWLNVWGDGEEWVRPKEPDSIHTNTLVKANGRTADRFKDVLTEINHRTGGAILTGMRCDESPARRIFMTTLPRYKWVTWSSDDRVRRPEFTPYCMFHPIYDWNVRDVWKAMFDHGWRYNHHYDTQFQYGIPIKNMRVSNYHHETALASLLYLQEVEPDTWAAATRRLTGINTHGHLRDDIRPTDLPYMFADWTEYATYLIEHLIPTEDYRATYRRLHATCLRALPDMDRDKIARLMIKALLRNDLYGTSVRMFLVEHAGYATADRRLKESA